MSRLLLFGGTTEGRILAEFCVESGIPVTVSVATPEGAALLPQGTDTLCGRLNMAEMRDILASGKYSRVVDATHPYAAEVTANLSCVCKELRIPYTRLLRESAHISGETAPDMDTLINRLNEMSGIILSTLGCKSLEKLTQVRDFRERLWVRILPSPETARFCARLGYNPAHVIEAAPPFSTEQNITHIRRSDASVLVTKESGKAGGYSEKCEAARLCHIPVLTLKRPEESGASLSQIKILLKKEFA